MKAGNKEPKFNDYKIKSAYKQKENYKWRF